MNTERLTTRGIARAAEIIRAGGLLALPTETVYGLGADGLNPDAVARIFRAKGRPQNNPLILHIPDESWLERCCADVPPAAYLLAEAFWPGPLTLILKAKDIVPRVTTGGLDTVGMRCPLHPAARAVIAAAGTPIAAPSANTSGRPSCTTAQDVLEDMDGKIDAVMDGGPCAVGVESTILDLTVDPPCLLRPGGLPREAIEAVLGTDIPLDRAVTAQMKPGERPRAPGMAYRHYAPKAPVTAVEGDPARGADFIRGRCTPRTGVICFDEYADRFAGTGAELQTLGGRNDLPAQARRVFDALRHFDGTDVTEIYAQCPAPEGLGLAVANRIKKAAGFRTILISKERPMKLIGITGPTGAGKTTALRELQNLGAALIDADAVYHELLENSREMNEAIRARFPMVYRDGVLDRRALGTIVFPNPAALADLDRIILPFVNGETDRRIEAAREAGLPAVGIDAINLLESEIEDRCDHTVAVVAPDEIRIERIMARDGISEEYARSRINAQEPCEYYEDLCEFTLVNDGDEAAFAEQARALFTQLLEG